jgi:hypothetical protein
LNRLRSGTPVRSLTEAPRPKESNQMYIGIGTAIIIVILLIILL